MAMVDRCEIVDTLYACKSAVEDLMQQEVIAVDAEGVNLGKEGPLTLLQIARLDGFVYLFNIYAEPRMFDKGRLKRILESKDIVKVIHACSGDSAALKCQFDVMLDNVFDIQAAQCVIDRADGRQLPYLRKLGDLCALYTETSLLDDKDKVKDKWNKSEGGYWAKEVLTPEMIDYACSDVRVMIPDVYESLKREIDRRNLHRELEEKTQHELHTRWDSTWIDKTNRKEVIDSILASLPGKYANDTSLEDVNDEDDIAAIKHCPLQNLKDYPAVVRKLKLQSLRTELELIEVAAREDDFVPLRSHHILATTGKKCDVPSIRGLATDLKKRLDDLQQKCMVVIYNENTPVNYLADFERRIIRNLPPKTAQSSNRVMRHLYTIVIQADMDDVDAERRRFLEEGKRFSIPSYKLGLFKFFLSSPDLPERLRNKALKFINELQDNGIIEAPKRKQPRPRTYNRYR